MKIKSYQSFLFICLLLLSIVPLSGCKQKKLDGHNNLQQQFFIKEKSYYGTLEPFASEAVYFLMTDRFVDGDPGNNQVKQGGDNPTFEQALVSKDGRRAYVGYMGGDFKGILNNADYIKEMGFSSIWLTPIVDQPDESFSGGEPITFGGAFKDGGKTGYHGYWGVNFFEVDEHLPSKDLSFKALTEQLREQYQMKTVLDIVLNHGSPAFSMRPTQQAKYGQLFDHQGKLLADHQNIEPEKLDPDNPLHGFYSLEKDIMQLSDFNPDNPQVLEYFTDAYLYWIGQGANAFRIDTIKHMPHDFWKKFTTNIRSQYPGFFMFAESYSFDATFIAQHTKPENGAISVLDFPGKEAIAKVFENSKSDFRDLLPYLYLDNSPYSNPYELMIFYDNHDMARMNADNNGFIDAHNWLFTSRGIPVIYYGSEMAFMAGAKEHEGNRNYFGPDNIEVARSHPVRTALKRIANVRKSTIALQKGLQINLDFSGDLAAFYRVFEHNGINQTALVMLNKGDEEITFEIEKYLSQGQWFNPLNHEKIQIGSTQKLTQKVNSHDVSVLILNGKNKNNELRIHLNKLM